MIMIHIPYDIKKYIMENYLDYHKCKICKKIFSINKKNDCCKNCYILFVIKQNIITLKEKIFLFTAYSLFLNMFFVSPLFFYISITGGSIYLYLMYLFIKSQ